MGKRKGTAQAKAYMACIRGKSSKRRSAKKSKTAKKGGAKSRKHRRTAKKAKK
jgi:hypothetical protein